MGIKESLRKQAKSKATRKTPPRVGKVRSSGGLIAEKINHFLNFGIKPPLEDVADFAVYMAQSVRRGINRQFTEAGVQEWHIRPSGQRCTRLEALRKLGRVPTATAPGTFFLGDVCEAFGRSVALLAGCNLVSENMKVTIPSLEIDKETGELKETTTSGEIDNLLKVGDKTYLVDFKSTANLKYIKEPYDDKWGYFYQQEVYSISEELQGTLDGFILVFIDKKDLHAAEIIRPIPPEDVIRSRWFDHIVQILFAERELPERPRWATLKRSNIRVPVKKTVEIISDVRCQYCNAVQACWGPEFTEQRKEKEWMRDVH